MKKEAREFGLQKISSSGGCLSHSTTQRNEKYHSFGLVTSATPTRKGKAMQKVVGLP